jgi:predicted transcriptional regulator
VARIGSSFTLGVAEEKIMAEEREDVEVSIEDALRMESIFSQALMDVMVANGLITEQEVLDRISEIKKATGFELG